MRRQPYCVRMLTTHQLIGGEETEWWTQSADMGIARRPWCSEANWRIWPGCRGHTSTLFERHPGIFSTVQNRTFMHCGISLFVEILVIKFFFFFRGSGSLLCFSAALCSLPLKKRLQPHGEREAWARIFLFLLLLLRKRYVWPVKTALPGWWVSSVNTVNA